ncbi:MAG: hypothetical protein AAF639_01275 [Chloroflexota bacterium]
MRVQVDWLRNWTHPLYLAIFSCIISVTISTILLRDGVKLTPDGWVYWEGSVSLLHGNGYVQLNGEPITAFPPLFSIYLAGIQTIVGIHGVSLIVGVVILAGLTSGIWSYLFSRLSEQTNTPPYQKLILPIYVSLFVSCYYRHLYSETLFLALLGCIYILIAQIHLQKGMNYKQPLWVQISLLNVLLVLLIFSRNAALAFVPSIILVLLLSLNHTTRLKRILIALVTSMFVMGCWIGLRGLLGANASHTFMLGGHYTPLDYITQMSTGLAYLFGPQTYGVGWFVLLLIGLSIVLMSYLALFDTDAKPSPQQTILMYLLAITLMSGVILYILFNLTWIHDTFSGRFLWFFGLGIIGVLAAYITWQSKRWIHLVLLAILLIVTSLQTIRTAAYIRNSLRDNSSPLLVAPHQTIGVDNGYKDRKETK